MDTIRPLSDLSEQLNTLFDELGEGCAFINKDEIIIDLNNVAADILGYPKEELIGTCFGKYMSEEEFSKIQEQTKIRQSGQVSTYFHTIIRKDGTVRELQSTVSPRFDNNTFIGAFGIIRDLTDLIRDKKRLEESEKRFRTVSDVISDFAVSFSISSDASFVHEWHSGLLPLRNITNDDSTLRKDVWFKTCHPDDLPVLTNAWQKVFIENEPVTFEYRILTGDNQYGWYEIYVNPEKSSSADNIGRVLIAGREVTEKKRAAQLQQLTYRLVNSVNLAHSIPDIFTVVRRELEDHIDCSNLTIGLVTPEQPDLTTYYQRDDRIHSEQQPMEFSLPALLIKSGKPEKYNHQQILDLINGNKISPHHAPLMCWAGIPMQIGTETFGIISVSSFEEENSITDAQFDLLVFIAPHIALSVKRKLDEVALKASEASLKESNISKDKFFSIIAHDLRGPFNAIIGFSDLLHNDYETLDISEQRSMIKNIYDASLGTFKLLENLLEWSRIQTGRTRPNPDNIDLCTIANTSLSFLKPQAEKKNIKLFSGIHFGTIAFCDENMITTVVRNLISNAIKFTPIGGNVRIWAAIKDQHVEVTVADNGVGIHQENLPKIFKLDESVKTRGTAGEQGTGLGLVLCREFIELNNGTISAESELGRGSQFRFTIPRSI
jgi:PAS domain S-box-containing protein